MSDTDIAVAIVDTMRQPVLVLEKDLRVAYANGAFLQSFRVEAPETLGQYLYDLGNGQWSIPGLRDLLYRVLLEGGPVRDYRVEHAFETIGWRSMVLNARALDQLGYDRILLAIDDVTDAERIARKLGAQKEVADTLIDSVREGLVVLSSDLRVDRVNASFCEMFNMTPKQTVGRLIYEVGNGQWDIPALRLALEDILPQRSSFNDFEVEHAFPEIGQKCMVLNGRQLNPMPLILLAIRDVTDSRKARLTEELLVGELQHRVKNVLANVQALASATLRRSHDLAEFRQTFLHRLQSLGRTQDLLLKGAEGKAGLHDIIAFEMAAHGREEDGRLSIAGPAVTLNRGQAQAFGMIVHELATNALKHGALSGVKGNLAISWCIDDGEEGELHLQWKESGVSMSKATGREGFGTGMIRDGVSYSLGGRSTMNFEEDGMVCQMVWPLHSARPVH